MKMLIITHASFEKPGSILTWAEKHNHTINEVKPYLGEMIPDVSSYDFIVVMGGPQSPLEIDKAPYLLDEITAIKEAIKLNKRLVGVCLGAQLIGEALGAKTERSPNREIGCYPLEMLEAANNDPVFGTMPKLLDVMHWHSDMPGIAEGATLIAKSAGCPRQIYRYGDRIYGFQCHFELTKTLVTSMIESCPDDLKPAQYVMTKEQLMNINYAEINARMDSVLDYLAQVPELNSTNTLTRSK